MKEKIVTVQKNAFLFCKIGVGVILWSGFIFRLKELILLAFVILGLSAILGVNRAPMILFYSNTIERLYPSKKVTLNFKAMRFAHTLGTILSFICVILLYTGPP